MHLMCICARRYWCIGDKSMESLHVDLDSYDQIRITASKQNTQYYIYSWVMWWLQKSEDEGIFMDHRNRPDMESVLPQENKKILF